MGNYKFKLSDMFPNAWFCKLKHSSTSSRSTSTNRDSTTKKPPLTLSNNTPASQPSKMLQPHLVTTPRKSYHFTRDQTAAPKKHDPSSFDTSFATTNSRDVYPETPRKSSKKRRSTRRSRQPPPRLVASSVSAGCSCRATIESVWTKPDSTPEDYPSSPLYSSSGNESLLPQHGSAPSLVPETFDGMLTLSTSSCKCRIDGDFVLEMENKPSLSKIDDPDKLHLPPIVTNKSSKVTKNRSSAKFEDKTAHGSISVKVIKEDLVSTAREQKSNPARKSLHSPGLKLRTNSPRIAAASRRIHGRRSVFSYSNSTSSSRRINLSESFAVVKSSKDPRKDFRESMVDMILENNIFESKKLEDLLACYLSLNSDEYHDLIIKVFKQIWFDIIDPKFK